MPTLKFFPPTRFEPYDVVIELKFYGEKFSFVVDTGCNKTCISQRLFNHLAAHSGASETLYRSIEVRQYHGCGGVETSQKVPLRINFLGKLLTGVTIGHFLDEWRTKGLTYHNHDGLLGQDVMRQFRQVVIDYEKGEISFNG